MELVEKTRDVLIDVGVLQRVKKEGPIKKGDDPYETRVNPKLLPFDDTGSNMLFYGGLGIAGAIAAGNAIMHPIKTTKALYKGGKALYKGGKWVKNKMFPGKGTVPDVKPPTSIADDVMKTGTNLVDMKTGTNLVDDAAKTGTTTISTEHPVAAATATAVWTTAESATTAPTAAVAAAAAEATATIGNKQKGTARAGTIAK